jgi:hypothetical protein
MVVAAAAVAAAAAAAVAVAAAVVAAIAIAATAGDLIPPGRATRIFVFCASRSAPSSWLSGAKPLLSSH